MKNSTLGKMVVGALLFLTFPHNTLFAEPADARPQVTYPEPSGEFTGVGKWRKQAPLHYYGGSCCYCLEASDARPSKKYGETEYSVKGEWWSVPNTALRPAIEGADPVENFYMICDPVKRKYTCVIPGAAG